jgi:hypothetical protein
MTVVGSLRRLPGRRRRRVLVDSPGPGSASASDDRFRARRVLVGASVPASLRGARWRGAVVPSAALAVPAPASAFVAALERRRRRGFASVPASAAGGVSSAPAVGAGVSAGESVWEEPPSRVARPRPRPPRRRRRRAEVEGVALPSPSDVAPDSPASASSAPADLDAALRARGVSPFFCAAARPDPDPERRRRVGAAVGSAPPEPSPSGEGSVAARSFWAGDARSGTASPLADVEPAALCEPVPGRLRPRPPRRRLLRAGAVPLPSVELPAGPVSGRSAAAASVEATADSIPASLTKHPFLSGHAGRTEHARAQRRCR